MMLFLNLEIKLFLKQVDQLFKKKGKSWRMLLIGSRQDGKSNKVYLTFYTIV